MIISTCALGHEGHNQTPGAVAAPNGGSVKGTRSTYLEAVYESGQIKLYVYDHDMKKMDASKFKIKAQVKLPKSVKATELELVESGGVFSSKVDVKGAHRFLLDLVLDINGKSEKASFNIEP
jgi:hypothetical protein